MVSRPLCLALLLAFGFQSGLRATAPPPPTWQPAGPQGAWVSSLLVDLKHPGVVYAGTNGDGIYRSTDGGVSWKLTGLGLVFGSTAVAAGPSAIYAGTLAGLYESRDDGATWSAIRNFHDPHASVFAVEADPAASTLLALASNEGYPTELDRSTDGGKHWTTVYSSDSLCCLTADHGAPGTYYAGTRDGILRSTDQGVTWTMLGLHALDNGLLWALAVDPVTHAVYAGGRSSTLYSSTDQGVSWRTAELPDGLGAIALSARAGRVYAGSAIVNAGQIRPHGLFTSTDGGLHWSASLPWLGHAIVNAIAVDPRAPQTIYVGADAWGVLKSTDAAVSWALSSQGLHGTEVMRVAVDPSHPGTLWAGTNGAGIWKTSNGGKSWQLVNTALDEVVSLGLDPRKPSTVFAASSRSLMRSRDGGAHWTALTQGLEGATFLPGLAIDPLRAGRVYLGTGRGFVLSGDGGNTWSASVSMPKCFGAWALSASLPGTVLAAGRQLPYCNPDEGSRPGGLFASTDGGVHWEDRTKGLSRYLQTMAVDPSIPPRLYVIDLSQLLRSTDRGASWQPTGLKLPQGDSVTTIAFGPGHPATVYAAADLGQVYRSTAGGTSWSPLGGAGLKNRIINDLTWDAATGTLYAATDDGLFSLATR